MEYRLEIDGLRAIAVLSVIFFHAGFEVISGGFLGVDIFFVISGYLITSLLIRDLAKERFSFAHFYERRIRRIIPALLVVSVVSMPFAALLMLPSQIDAFAKSLISVMAFVSNLFFWSQSGYFSPSVDLMPMIHTWSLAIEEQFYLFFPPLLIVLWKFLKLRSVLIVALILVVSLALSEYAWRHNPSANFYFLPTRAWELLTGAVGAFFVYKYGVWKNQILSILGLSMIIFSLFFLDDTLPFPSLYGTIPVFGTVLVIVFSGGDTIVTKFLRNKLFVGVGLISYSAYLWHQPILAYSRLYLSEGLSESLSLFLCVLVLGLSYLSWKFVEQPFRDNTIISKRMLYQTTAGSALLMTGIAFAITTNSSHIEKAWLSKKSEAFQQTYRLVKAVTQERSDFFLTEEGKQLLNECRFNVNNIDESVSDRLLSCSENHGAGTLIIGDSHAIDLYGVVISRFDDPFLVGVTQGDCHPSNLMKDCQYQAVLRFVSEHPKVFKHIIYEQAGFYLLKHNNDLYKNREMFTSVPLNGRIEGVVSDKTQIAKELDYLEALGQFVPITWFLPRIEHHIDFNFILQRGCQHSWNYRENQAEQFQRLDADILELIQARDKSRVNGLSQNQVLGFDLQQDLLSCDNVFWSDGNHYSSAGEKRFGQRLPDNFLLQM